MKQFVASTTSSNSKVWKVGLCLLMRRDIPQCISVSYSSTLNLVIATDLLKNRPQATRAGY